jgi:hypothetical protein
MVGGGALRWLTWPLALREQAQLLMALNYLTYMHGNEPFIENLYRQER